jgi:hypothetical protein
MEQKIRIAVFLSFIFVCNLFSAETEDLFRIKLKDGTTLIATILQSNEEGLVVQTTSIPQITIPVAQILEMTPVSAEVETQPDTSSDIHSTHYLVGQSAFNLKKGEAYYKNTEIFLNSFTFGITDNFSLEAGLEFLSIFAEGDPIMYIMPKVGYQVSDKFHLGASFMLIGQPIASFSNNEFLGLGLGYGMGTFGAPNSNVTVGIGGLIDSAGDAYPLLNLSGMHRISKSVALITENEMIISNNISPVFSYGVRFLMKNSSFDLALANSKEIAKVSIVGFPVISIFAKL